MSPQHTCMAARAVYDSVDIFRHILSFLDDDKVLSLLTIERSLLPILLDQLYHDVPESVVRGFDTSTVSMAAERARAVFSLTRPRS